LFYVAFYVTVDLILMNKNYVAKFPNFSQRKQSLQPLRINVVTCNVKGHNTNLNAQIRGAQGKNYQATYGYLHSRRASYNAFHTNSNKLQKAPSLKASYHYNKLLNNIISYARSINTLKNQAHYLQCYRPSPMLRIATAMTKPSDIDGLVKDTVNVSRIENKWCLDDSIGEVMKLLK
jgi:hypothetical protein